MPFSTAVDHVVILTLQSFFLALIPPANSINPDAPLYTAPGEIAVWTAGRVGRDTGWHA